MGIKGIAAAFDVSRNTVRKYVRLWQDSSLTIEQLLALPEHRLREMFIPKGGVTASRHPVRPSLRHCCPSMPSVCHARA